MEHMAPLATILVLFSNLAWVTSVQLSDVTLSGCHKHHLHTSLEQTVFSLHAVQICTLLSLKDFPHKWTAGFWPENIFLSHILINRFFHRPHVPVWEMFTAHSALFSVKFLQKSTFTRPFHPWPPTSSSTPPPIHHRCLATPPLTYKALCRHMGTSYHRNNKMLESIN